MQMERFNHHSNNKKANSTQICRVVSNQWRTVDDTHTQLVEKKRKSPYQVDRSKHEFSQSNVNDFIYSSRNTH